MTGGWEMGLAATKLHPPIAPAPFVRRSRLDDVLDAGIDRHLPLLLVSAPAGSGKSTLVGPWLAGRREPVAWLQVESSDSDPARFWSYLLDAIGQAHPDVATAVKPVVTGSGGDDLAVVTALVNELADLAQPLIVVVDDYHLIDNASVHRGMERLVDLCPPQVTIVLSTRIDPPFRLGRLRVRDQIAEIRADDLRFANDEAADLLGGGGSVPLERSLLDQLCGRTEGWAAGLVLAGLSLERTSDPAAFVESFKGDDHLVVDYLRDELLASVATDDLRRLLESSILEQLSGPLVDAVTGTEGGAGWLRATARVNQLLIGLDHTGTWFRFHHLLRDLLRLEAEQTFPERLPDLHARAAAWFEEHGDHRQAVVHRLAAGETAEAAALMRVLGPQLLRNGQIETLRGLLEQLGDVASQSTACALLSGWCAFIGGRYATAEVWLDQAYAVAPAGLDLALLSPLRINIHLGNGDVASALAMADAAREADALVSHPSDLATAVGATYAWAGRAGEARAALRLAVEKATLEPSPSVHVLALVYLAVVELEASPAPTAHAAATTALDTASGFGLAAYHGIAAAYAIRARTSDDATTAGEDARRALELVRRASTDLALGFVLTLCGDTLLDLDDPAGAAVLEEARAVLDRCPDPGVAGRHLARIESRRGVADVGTTQRAVLVEQLTEREMAVLRQLPTPSSQRDIAAELYVSLNTVKTHCRAIYRKLGVSDRKAAIQAARDLHLL
jgi:LuxR family maltose regulon positive regulatory protein